MSTEFNFPTETVELPSKGLLYPLDNPLSSGKVEMKYMTAKEEDILTNTNYIQQGVVVDKLLQSLIVSNVNYNDLLVGDKNALLVASRILGYGKDYSFQYLGTEYNIDLTSLPNVNVDESLFSNRENKFTYKLPHTGVELTFKLLTHQDENNIEEELKNLRRVDKNSSKELVTRLNYMILAVNGDSSQKTIRNFTENHFLAKDSREFRNYVKSIQPDVDMRFYPEGGPEGGVEIPIGISFLWPDI